MKESTLHFASTWPTTLSCLLRRWLDGFQNGRGKKFTFIRDNGLKFITIAWFLIFSNFVDIQPQSVVIAHPEVNSDHDFFGTVLELFHNFRNLDRLLMAIIKFVKGQIKIWKMEDVKKSFGVVPLLRMKIEEIEKEAKYYIVTNV